MRRDELGQKRLVRGLLTRLGCVYRDLTINDGNSNGDSG